MFDIILEITRAIIISTIFIYIILVGEHRKIRKQKGWTYIIVGFGLILFGSIIDITDNFESLNKYLIIGDTEYQAFLEKIVGYLFGYFFLALGIFKCTPLVIDIIVAKDRLKTLSENLEKQVNKKTADLKKFKLAVENASDHIIITDPDGIILYLNKAAERITQFSIKESIGKKSGTKKLWGGLMSKLFYENLWKIIKEDKNTFIGEIKNRRKDGEEYIAAVSISPILDKNDDIIFFVGIERDITKEKEIDKAKTEFVSLASHQLRTPLTSIKWHAEMLLAGDFGKLNKEQQNYLQEVYDGNQRMIDLVNSLLNVSKLELGTFIIEPELINITEIADSVIKELIETIKQKKIKFSKKYDKKLSKLNLDKNLTRMIFQNLLSNALKYTKENGKIDLNIKKNEKGIEIIVSDTGIGIPKFQHDKIFTKLFRADNVMIADTEGTGLGLYIVKLILDKIGGKISFESEKNNGTIFRVVIPSKGMAKK